MKEENDHHKDFFNNQIKLTKWREKFYNEIYLDLKTNDSYASYFSQYDEESVQQFIEYYAQQKVKWHEYGEQYGELLHERNDDSYQEGIKVIKLIQLKKIFNLICQWGLAQVTLPGIEVSQDLIDMCDQILECPFIETVQQQNIEDYISFLYESPCDKKLSKTSEVTLYGAYFEKNNTIEDWLKDNYCDYFLWHDKRYDTTHFLQQPITRIVKEWYYARASSKSESKNIEPTIPKEAPKPYAFFHNIGDSIVDKYETSDFKEKYNAIRKREKQREFIERIEIDIVNLSEAKVKLPVEDNKDWRQSLMQANEQHKRTQLAAELPYVFKTYLKRTQANKDFDDWEKKPFPFYFNVMEGFKEAVLKGRTLLGEPADFNF